MKTLKRFTIDRSKWINGTTLAIWDTNSRLFSTKRDDGVGGKMCCMGFLAAACGISTNVLRGTSTFGELGQTSQAKIPEDVLVDADLFYAMNDAGGSPKKREQRIAAKLKKLGITVKYVGKYPKRERNDE